MDLTNKQIRITRTSANYVPPSSIIWVDVLEEPVPGVRKVYASFELMFDEAYGDPSNPALLTAVTEKLATL